MSKKRENIDDMDIPSMTPGNTLEGMMFGQSGSQEDEALMQAQALMYEAMESEDPFTRIMFSALALAESPDCADAYEMLANEAPVPEDQMLKLHRKAVEAGRRVLGEEVFENDAGHFWGLIETRPYMRARQGYAEALYFTGRLEKAAEHFKEILRLNPNDNQGIRDIYMPCLIQLDRDKEAWELYREYEEDSLASWCYDHALLEFRKEGDSKSSQQFLSEAYEKNELVWKYLCNVRKMPGELPGHYTLGGKNEAILYAFFNKPAWEYSEGALQWLKTYAKKQKKK